MRSTCRGHHCDVALCMTSSSRWHEACSWTAKRIFRLISWCYHRCSPRFASGDTMKKSIWTSDGFGQAFSLRPLMQVIGIGLALMMAGCTTYPPAPREAATSDFQYKIGPLDTVNIIVWRNPELSMVVPVRPDGNVTTPLADDIPALGKTPTALAKDIEQALSKYIRDPVVTVVVTTFVGPKDAQIRVIGEATRPQILP